MSCTQCLVTPSVNDGWLAKINEREFGPYYSRDMALRVAISEALQRRRAGHPARVAVRDRNGAITAKRCLCASFGQIGADGEAGIEAHGA